MSKSELSTQEGTDAQTIACGDCAELSGEFPCATCYINGWADFE